MAAPPGKPRRAFPWLGLSFLHTVKRRFSGIVGPYRHCHTGFVLKHLIVLLMLALTYPASAAELIIELDHSRTAWQTADLLKQLPLEQGASRHPTFYLYSNKDKPLGPATQILVELLRTFDTAPLDAPFAAPRQA